MTTLSTFELGEFSDVAGAKVESISTARLYYVYTGRNAWHSTWIRKYSKGCMHTSLKSAKDYVEKKRVQGTVFNIEELPAIAFKSSAGDIIATQINTRTPLEAYSPDAISNVDILADIYPHLNLDNYIQLGAPMLGVALSFRHWSRFWSVRQQESDAAIVVVTRDKSAEYNHDLDEGFKSYSSYTQGGNYRLGWFTRDAEMSAAPINTILSYVTDEL